MAFVFSFWDLALWMGAIALIMLIASELLMPYSGRKNAIIEIKKLRTVGILFSVAFVFAVGVRILSLSNG